MESTAAFKIIVDNKKLIYSSIRQGALGATKEEIEDLNSQITIELAERFTKSVEDGGFDPDRGVKATTYLAMVARSRALDLSRGRKYHAAFDTGADDSEDTYSYSRELAANDTGVSAFEAREEIQAALAKLGDKLGGAPFVIDYFVNDMDIAELCTKYAIAPGTCYSRVNKIREFLKAELAE
jgi:RNA polymerase sigma factor (sigma-70 family)